jgi:outer membrane protein OmpA-like peptidoglycan-associated protein
MIGSGSLSKVMGAALLAAAAATVAVARDVRVFSREEAEFVLTGSEPAATGVSCPVRLPNGACARSTEERGFSIDRSRSSCAGSRSPIVIDSRGHSSSVFEARAIPLQFGRGSNDLSPQSRGNLQMMATVLNLPQHRMKRVMITGHTDKAGSFETNCRLSQQRAEAVADYLNSRGVARTRLEAFGRGSDSPLPGLSPFDPRNRRVEIVRID